MSHLTPSASLNNGDLSTTLLPDEYGEGSWDDEMGPKLLCTCCGKRCCCSTTSRTKCVLGSFFTFITVVIALWFFNQYVILPIIVQKALDDSNLEFYSASLKDPVNKDITLAADGIATNVNTFGLKASVHPADLSMYYHGEYMGSLRSESMDIGGDNNAIHIQGRGTVSNEPAFDAFGRATVYDPITDVRIEGDVVVELELGSWPVQVHGITLDKSLDLPGLNNSMTTTIEAFQVYLDAASGHVVGEIRATLTNPSIISIVPFGNLTFEAYFEDVVVGQLLATDVSLFTGPNELFIRGVLFPKHKEQLSDMISNYVAGEPSNLRAVGLNHGGCSVPLYDPIMSNLTLDTTLVSHRIRLGTEVIMHPYDFADILKRLFLDKAVEVPCGFGLHNPFMAPVKVTGVNLNVTYGGYDVGYADKAIGCDSSPINIIIPPNSTKVYNDDLICVNLSAKEGASEIWQLIVALWKALSTDFVLLGLRGFIDLQVGDLELTAHYEQPELPACIFKHSEKCENWKPSDNETNGGLFKNITLTWPGQDEVLTIDRVNQILANTRGADDPENHVLISHFN